MCPTMRTTMQLQHHTQPPPPQMQCKLHMCMQYAPLLLGKDHHQKMQRVSTTRANRLIVLVAGGKTPPAQVAEFEGIV